MQFKSLFLTITFLLNVSLISFAQEPTFLEHGGGVRTVEFSPVNTSLVASAGESHLIKLWNLQDDTVRTLVGHTGRVNSIAFSPNGELLASVSDDRTIKLWSVHNQQNIRTLQDGTRYRSVVFSPDGQVLATGGGMHVKLWNVRNQVEMTTLQNEQWVRVINFSYNGQLLVAGDDSGTVKVWDVKSRQVVVSLNANPKNVKAVEFSSDNQYLASSGWNGYLKVWDVSNWELQHTIPNTGHYDIAFSPDEKILASTSNGYVSLWWVEDGARVAQLKGPTDWIHPVDFSHDGISLAVGAEDGIIRIWRIDTSLEDNGDSGVRILHVDTYLQQLPGANSVRRGNIPEPVPPPAIVREYFQLDPFYQQWIDVRGLPVIASAKVNPYALKEAAWIVRKMIGHRPDVLRAMVGNKTRFSVIGYTEIITEIPEYREDAPPDFVIYRERGWGGSKQATVSSSEENLLSYPGPHSRSYNVLIHEFAHAIHRLGLNTLDPTFDERLQMTYKASMKKGLWQGTYASSDRKEYWAEGTMAWFHPTGGHSFSRLDRMHHNTRQALKEYDPGLATLLTEFYGDGGWRYTPVAIRTHLPHLQGFDPQDSPMFEGWPELKALYQQLSDPSSDGGGVWVNLNPYAPNQLSRLMGSNVHGERTTMIFVNSTDADVLIYGISSNATESFRTRIYPDRVRWTGSSVNKIWLVKDTSGRNIAVFQSEEKTGRALIGTSANKVRNAARENGRGDNSQSQVLIPESQRPPMYWIDAEAGTLHRLIGAKVETLVPSVQNATSLAVDMADEKLYWMERMSDRTGRIQRSNLDGTNIQLVKDLTSVPRSIAIDSANDKLYLTNSWGKVQRLNVDGSNFQPNLIAGLQSPNYLALDVVRDKIYWTEQTGNTTSKIQRASLDGTNVELVKNLTSAPRGITVDSVNGKIYLTNGWGKIQRLNLDGSNFQPNLIIDLQSPKEITVDVADAKLYWAEKRRIRRANLNGENIQDIITGLGAPTGVTLGMLSAHIAIPAAPAITIVPEQTLILANYPNPFNPETWIPYQLSKPEEVTLHIYAVNGTLIRTLALGHQPTGMYHSKSRAAYWDGRNEQGERVASGVYLYTLSAGDFRETRKMFIRK